MMCPPWSAILCIGDLKLASWGWRLAVAIKATMNSKKHPHCVQPAGS